MILGLELRKKQVLKKCEVRTGVLLTIQSNAM